MMFGYGATDAHYTYDPFGNHLESETIDDAITRFRFAGYKWDNTTGMYNCNARWYDPQISRFTGRDPVKGNYQEPLTLHAYLYCANNPANCIDPSGKIGFLIGGSISFSGDEAAGFATNAMSATRDLFGGAFGQAMSAAMGLMARNAYTMQAIGALGGRTGGTVGRGVAVGYGDGEFFGGSVTWGAGGVAKGASFSAVADFGISNANSLQDFAGTFIEAGGSIPWANSLFLNGSLGGTLARAVDSNVWLFTASVGGGVGKGYEGHVFVGRAWVEEW